MAIEKYISTSWDIQGTFLNDGYTKVATFNPDIFIPSEIQNFMDNFKPDPRFCYVHTIAATDGSRYGSNLNGDILDGEELTGMQSHDESMGNLNQLRGIPIPRYKTFEQAKFFRHHANSPTDPHYGDIPVAAWNEPMRRIELIIRIYKQDMPDLNGYGAPDIVAKLDRRGFITVSMGCKIHHEQCDYCSATNELIKDRCPCLRDNMNQIMPDGRQVRALNFGIRFFDCSDVGIPADPLAFSLSKVAGLSTPPNMARDVDQHVFGAWTKKLSEIVKEFPAGSIAEIPVDSVPDMGMCDCAPADMSDEEVKQAFALAGNLDSFVSTTALMGIVLSPRELALVTALNEPEKNAESTLQYSGIRNLLLDNFSVSLYHSLRDKTAERSGFLVQCHKTGWQPTKIAQAGYQDVADYYSFYRGMLGSLQRDGFVKAAYKNQHVRELLGSDSNEQNDRVRNALYHLAHAGMAV